MPAVLLQTTWWQCRAEHANLQTHTHTHTHTHISTHSQELHQIPERSQRCAAQVPPLSNLMAVYFALSASRLLRRWTAAEQQQREREGNEDEEGWEPGGVREGARCVGGFEKQRGNDAPLWEAAAWTQGWGPWSSAETVTPGNSCSTTGPDWFRRAPKLTGLPQVSALTKKKKNPLSVGLLRALISLRGLDRRTVLLVFHANGMLKSFDMQSMSCSCFVSASMKSPLFLDLRSVYLMLHLSVSAGWIRACVSLPLCYVSSGASRASNGLKTSQGPVGPTSEASPEQQQRVRPSCNAFQELHKHASDCEGALLPERRRHKHNLSRSRSENMRAARCLVASWYPETRLLILMMYLRLWTIQWLFCFLLGGMKPLSRQSAEV